MPNKLTKKQKLHAVRKARKIVNDLVFQSKLQQKLNRMSLVSHYYGIKNINEMEDNRGNVELADNAATDRLPLAMVSLRSIRNGGVSAAQMYSLKQDGYSFENINSVDYLGSTGNIDNGSVGDTTQNRQLLHNYSLIKLLLWQSSASDAHFNIKLVRFSDSDLDPLQTGETSTNASVRNKRRLFYKYLLLRGITTNPLITSTENFTRDIKNCYKVLWNKDYHIDEQSSTKEQAHYREVKIFRKFNQIVRYSDNPVVNTISNFDDPNTIVYPNNTNTATAYPQTKDNLFLIITANCTLSQDETASDFDFRTFDILVKNKFTTTINNSV